MDWWIFFWVIVFAFCNNLPGEKNWLFIIEWTFYISASILAWGFIIWSLLQLVIVQW